MINDTISETVYNSMIREGQQFRLGLETLQAFLDTSLLDKHEPSVPDSARYPYPMKTIYNSYLEYYKLSGLKGTLFALNEVTDIFSLNGYDVCKRKIGGRWLYFLDADLQDWSLHFPTLKELDDEK